MKALIDRGAEMGVESVVIGMPHRGAHLRLINWKQSRLDGVGLGRHACWSDAEAAGPERSATFPFEMELWPPDGMGGQCVRASYSCAPLPFPARPVGRLNVLANVMRKPMEQARPAACPLLRCSAAFAYPALARAAAGWPDCAPCR